MDDKHLAHLLRTFATERDWDQFHSPKNLAIAISTEAAELLELFQWSRGTHDWGELDDPGFKSRVAEELADVLLYLIRFADRAGIDLERAALQKLELNGTKYPVERFRGSDKKYNEE